MYRPTLSNFRAQWPDEAMGKCQADPAVVAYCNDAQQRLMMDPLAPDEGWWGGWVTMVLTGVRNGNHSYVTTPREVARLIVMDVCSRPISIRNGFYEYLHFGTGLEPKPCRGIGCGHTFQTFERDNVPTLVDLLPTAQTIRIYPTDARDSGLRVLVQGLDANGQVVLTTDPGTGVSAPGEYLPLSFPFVDSTNTFTKITGIQKDETFGNIQIFQVDPVSGGENQLSTMEPNEQSANYRRYLLSNIPALHACCSTTPNVQITAQARLDFIPVANETDYLMIQNVPALIEEAQSIRWSRMDSPNASEKSQEHHVRALQLLNGQLDQNEGKTSTSVKVPIFGSNRLHRQPV